MEQVHIDERVIIIGRTKAFVKKRNPVRLTRSPAPYGRKYRHYLVDRKPET